MEDFNKALLPIGSVVMLKGAEEKVMIMGRAQICNEQFWDYACCLYPLGHLDPNKMVVCNRKDIDCVFYVGYQDDSEEALRESLEKYIDRKRTV